MVLTVEVSAYYSENVYISSSFFYGGKCIHIILEISANSEFSHISILIIIHQTLMIDLKACILLSTIAIE